MVVIHNTVIYAMHIYILVYSYIYAHYTIRIHRLY